MPDMKTIPANMLDTMRPFLREKARGLVKEAFEIAVFLEEPQILDTIWEELAQEFDGTDQPGEPVQRTDVSHPYLEAPQGANLVTKEPLGSSVPQRTRPTKTHYNHSLPDPALTRTHELTKTGRPMSKYNGVCWTEGKVPWRARYASMDLGRYLTEEEAAEKYDEYVFGQTRSLMRLNFPERYQNQ